MPKINKIKLVEKMQMISLFMILILLKDSQMQLFTYFCECLLKTDQYYLLQL